GIARRGRRNRAQQRGRWRRPDDRAFARDDEVPLTLVPAGTGSFWLSEGERLFYNSPRLPIALAATERGVAEGDPMVVTVSRAKRQAEIVAPDQVIDTPTMVVDESIMIQNISEMQSMANSYGVALRPHIKTHKTPQIANLQVGHGAIGITCAKLGEAEA